MISGTAGLMHDYTHINQSTHFPEKGRLIKAWVSESIVKQYKINVHYMTQTFHWIDTSGLLRCITDRIFVHRVDSIMRGTFTFLHKFINKTLLVADLLSVRTISVAESSVWVTRSPRWLHVVYLNEKLTT